MSAFGSIGWPWLPGSRNGGEGSLWSLSSPACLWEYAVLPRLSFPPLKKGRRYFWPGLYKWSGFQLKDAVDDKVPSGPHLPGACFWAERHWWFQQEWNGNIRWQPEPKSPVLGRELSFLSIVWLLPFSYFLLDQISRPTDYLTSETAGEKGKSTLPITQTRFSWLSHRCLGSSPRPLWDWLCSCKEQPRKSFDLKTAGVSPGFIPELSSSSNCSGSRKPPRRSRLQEPPEPFSSVSSNAGCVTEACPWARPLEEHNEIPFDLTISQVQVFRNDSLWSWWPSAKEGRLDGGVGQAGERWKNSSGARHRRGNQFACQGPGRCRRQRLEGYLGIWSSIFLSYCIVHNHKSNTCSL